jgi:3-oxoacyl-[acyl-carrier-protein] synthase-3
MPKQAWISAVDYFLPESRLTNHSLSQFFPDFSEEKILAKTGIRERAIAAEHQTSTWLACQAAERIFTKKAISRDQIDFVIFCTQTPETNLPSRACVIQAQLGLNKSVGALDFNLGCSGYVYGLALAKGLIETGQAQQVLFLTADTYTHLIEPEDKSVRTIFGDGGSASLVSAFDEPLSGVSVLATGTDGSGAANLCLNATGHLQMLGPQIFEFTLEVVPNIINKALQNADLQFDQIDLFVFHQANAYMLEHLRKKLQIPMEKFWVAMDFCGNTVSSSIPIALTEACQAGVIAGKRHIMLVGFGVGYSWGATIINPLKLISALPHSK